MQWEAIHMKGLVSLSIVLMSRGRKAAQIGGFFAVQIGGVLQYFLESSSGWAY